MVFVVWLFRPYRHHSHITMHDYGNDMLMILVDGKWTTLLNECKNPITPRDPTKEYNNSLNEDVKSPSRQVPLSSPVSTEQVDNILVQA